MSLSIQAHKSFLSEQNVVDTTRNWKCHAINAWGVCGANAIGRARKVGPNRPAYGVGIGTPFMFAHGFQHCVNNPVNSLAPLRYETNFITTIFKFIVILGPSCEVGLMLVPQHITDDNSTVAQVMAWRRKRVAKGNSVILMPPVRSWHTAHETIRP